MLLNWSENTSQAIRPFMKQIITQVTKHCLHHIQSDPQSLLILEVWTTIFKTRKILCVWCHCFHVFFFVSKKIIICTSNIQCLYLYTGKYSDPLKFFTLCYIAAICWNHLSSFFSSLMYTQHPVLTEKHRIVDIFADLLKKKNWKITWS